MELSKMSHKELEEHFSDKYGSSWDRMDDLSEEEDKQWVRACYEYFEGECERRPAFQSEDDEHERFTGKDFEIIGRVEIESGESDLCALPMWKVRVGQEEFTAYPNEIFLSK